MQIFANTFPVHYSPPDGFHFEMSESYDPVQVLLLSGNRVKLKQRMVICIIECHSCHLSLTMPCSLKFQDNPFLFDFNVQQRVDDFINAAMFQVILSES